MEIKFKVNGLGSGSVIRLSDMQRLYVEGFEEKMDKKNKKNVYKYRNMDEQ